MSDNNFINWSELYAIGIEKIDNQHQKLIELINKLFNSFSEGKAEEATPEILKELTEYSDYHFKTEEKLFEEHNFSNTEEHLKKHKEFTEKVGSWIKRLEEGEKDLHYELMNYLKKWLTEHILEDDKEYGSEIKSKI